MESLNITVNDKEIIANLHKLIEDGLPEKLLEGLTKAALIVEAAAKEKCPVDDGQLRQSITHEINAKNLEITIGTNVEYAPYVEIGTGIYSTKGTGRTTPWVYQSATGEFITTSGTKSQPFLEPAAQENLDRIIESFRGIL